VMSRDNSAADDSTEPEPCETCEPKLMQIAHGNEYECPDCGQVWVNDGRGVQPAEQVDA